MILFRNHMHIIIFVTFQIVCILRLNSLKVKKINLNVIIETNPIRNIVVWCFHCLSSSFVHSYNTKVQLPFYVGSGIVEGWFGFTVVPLHSKAAALYLQIRQRLAKPLYQLSFYLKTKADLDPVASLSFLVSLSFRLSVTCLTCSFLPSIFAFVCHFCLSLSCFSLLPLCHPFSSSFVLYLSSGLSVHMHTHLISAASVHLLS